MKVWDSGGKGSRILALRGPWREGEESPDSRKVGGGWVGEPSSSGSRAIGKSRGTKGEHGGSVEGRSKGCQCSTTVSG